MIKYAILFLLFSSFLQAYSIEDQLNFMVREGENKTSVEFGAQNGLYHMLFINCIPAAILEQRGDELLEVSPNQIEDLVAEYLRQGYRGCNNEYLDLNYSAIVIITQMPSRLIEAHGIRQSMDREETLQQLKNEKTQIEETLFKFNKFELVALNNKLNVMDDNLRNLRKVKTDASITYLSSEFDKSAFDAKTILKDYQKILPYYYPAAAAISNASLAIDRQKLAYGENDEWLTNQARELLALKSDLSSLEKDLAIGATIQDSQFSSIYLRAIEIRQNATRRPKLIPTIVTYFLIFVILLSFAGAIYVKLRGSHKVVKEDIPKIRKLLDKLRKIEQKEEESA
ncbi:hypothetical protein HY989_05775 [Candidatus Micrarchaeota archaeon]|nr:hypothetical protein [Candidatus Micrarchaeota archaeon]